MAVSILADQLAEGLHVSTHNVISINYAPGMMTNVQKIDANKLESFLIGDGGREVVIFIWRRQLYVLRRSATLRGSWAGITSTHYEAINLQTNPEPQFSEVKLLAIESDISNGKWLQDQPAKILDTVESVLAGADSVRGGGGGGHGVS